MVSNRLVKSFSDIAFQPARSRVIVGFFARWAIRYLDMEKRKAEGTFDLKRHIAVGRARTEHRFAAFYHLSRNRQDAFKAFLELCREHHIQLVIFLTPLHSEALQHLAKNTEYLARQQELETFLHSLTSVYEFPILNFTDIQHFKGVSKDFKDYVHYLKLNGQRIIDEITKHISLKGF